MQPIEFPVHSIFNSMDSGIEGQGLEPQSTRNAHLYFIIDNFYDLYIVHMVCEGVTTHTAFRAQRA